VLCHRCFGASHPEAASASSSGGSPKPQASQGSVDSAQQPGKYAAGSHLDETPDAVSREMAKWIPTTAPD